MAPTRTSIPMPTKPTLSIPSHSARDSKQRLVFQEDRSAGQYQLRSLGDPASASVVSLGNWRPVAWAPPDFVHEQCPSSPNDSCSDQATSDERPPRKGIARITAWVKQSGKGLVLRLRRQSNKTGSSFTDVHLVPELGDSEIRELPTVPDRRRFDVRTELSAAAPLRELRGNETFARELECSESRFELPTLHWLEDLPANDTRLPPARETQEASPSDSARDYGAGSSFDLSGLPQEPSLPSTSPRPEETLSPTGTVRTDFSTADTAVEGADGEPGADMGLPNSASQTVARALTVSKSVRFRCEAHKDFEPASPLEVMRLIHEPPSLKRRNTDSNAGTSPAAAITTAPHDQLSKTLLGSATSDLPTADSDAGDNCNSVKRSVPQLEQHLSSQAFYGATSSTLLYPQDLLPARAIKETHAFSTEIVNLPLSLLQNPDALKAFLARLAAINTPFERKQISNLGSGQSTGSQRSSRTSQVTSGEASSDFHNDEGTEQSVTAAANQVTLRAGVLLQEKPITEDELRQSVSSPISPLTIREKAHRSHSITSPVVPITPLTPHPSKTPPGLSPSEHPEPPTLEDSVPVPSSIAGDFEVQADLEEALNETSPKDTDLTNIESEEHALTPLQASTQSERERPVAEIEVKRHLADWVDHQHSPAPVEPLPIPPLGYLSDDKIPARFKNTRFKELQRIDTNIREIVEPKEPSDVLGKDAESPDDPPPLLRTGRADPGDPGAIRGASATIISGLAGAVMRSMSWLQRHAGQEPPVPDGHVRIRWTCNCGERLYDDFQELRTGAASILEATLNKENPHPYVAPGSNARGSQSSFSQTPGSSSHPSSGTSWSSHSAGYPPSGYPWKGTPRSARSMSYYDRQHPFPPPPPEFLLTCVNEARHTPKLTNIPLHTKQVQTDKELAVALREHYADVNRQWYRCLRLRGLTSIEFIQFYMHKNRFADVRKCPDVPKDTYAQGYQFEHSDLLPPVGGRYLLHLFKHPQEYDGETVAYQNIPKKLERLDYGIGWGIILTEGFLPERMWLFILLTFVLFGLVFAVVWKLLEHDIQGAFGVASFLTSLAGIVASFTQACLG